MRLPDPFSGCRAHRPVVHIPVANPKHGLGGLFWPSDVSRSGLTCHDSFTMADREHQEEIVAKRRPIGGIVASALALVGFGYIILTGGESDEEAVPAPTEPTIPTTTAAPTTAAPDSVTPAVDGRLPGGEEFVVYEPTPGVLCAVINASPAAQTAPDNTPAAAGADIGAETCHLELVTSSGAAVIDTRLAFGYLSPGASSASLRYRTNGVSNDGIRIEPNARFFALPITGADPYRLQYRTANFDLDNEVPLVSMRGGAAQSAAEATAQGVPSSVAALSFNRRVQVVDEWTRFIEGPYAWSTLPTSSIEPGWAEFLQLDNTGTEIVRAVPFPNVRLNAILGTRDALYLIGQQVSGQQVTMADDIADDTAIERGELRLPIVVARIERPRPSNSGRTTTGATVRVFPQEQTGVGPAPSPDVSRSGWQLGPELPPIDPYAIASVGGRIQIEGDGNEGAPILLDPVTLLPSEA